MTKGSCKHGVFRIVWYDDAGLSLECQGCKVVVQKQVTMIPLHKSQVDPGMVLDPLRDAEGTVLTCKHCRKVAATEPEHLLCEACEERRLHRRYHDEQGRELCVRCVDRGKRVLATDHYWSLCKACYYRFIGITQQKAVYRLVPLSEAQQRL